MLLFLNNSIFKNGLLPKVGRDEKENKCGR